jgi:ferric-dicitrate binding protein FerR (iron transport regulator)
MDPKIPLFLFILSFSSPAAFAAAEGCTVNQVTGSAHAMREGQEIPVERDFVLQKGDTLMTASDATVDMSMNDLAGCRALGGTEVEVLGWKPANMALKVSKGNVILNLKDLPETAAFKVETPTAVATVRGTQFWGRVDTAAAENPVTTFAVREGSVEVAPAGVVDGGPIQLQAGQALDITKMSGSYSVRDALPEEMAAMEQASSIPTGA